MNASQKKEFVKKFGHRTTEFSEKEWEKVCNEFSIKFTDIMNNDNSKYAFLDANGKEKSFVWTISNGNAFDCPALKSNRCNVDCYGLKGCFSWNPTKVNKRFQGIILNLAPLGFIFDVIKHFATSKRMNPLNRLRFLRLNEVSDLTESLYNRVLVLCEMLYSDAETKHIRVFTYSKMNLDFQKVLEHPNLTINASQTLNSLYLGGNTFIAVDKEFYDSIVETDIIRKCDCTVNCHNCELCYANSGLIIFCLIH